jgi:hypothetical protein
MVAWMMLFVSSRLWMQRGSHVILGVTRPRRSPSQKYQDFKKIRLSVPPVIQCKETFVIQKLAKLRRIGKRLLRSLPCLLNPRRNTRRICGLLVNIAFC